MPAMATSETPEGWPGDTREPWPGDPDEQAPTDVPVAPGLDEADERDPLQKSDNTSEAAVEPPD